MAKVMLWEVKSLFQNAFNRNTRYQSLMLIFCILFGVAMIADTQIAGDGSWFWYATLFHGGKRLYADMHLALQPLFVLETSCSLTLLGNGWLVCKIPAVLHLVFYCVGLLLVVRYSTLTDRQKAIIFGCAFFVSVCSIAYRFDDYHVVAESLEVYSIVLLMMLQKVARARPALLLGTVLGIISGLTFTTRINDGAALFVAVGIAILAMAPFRRLLSLLLFSFAAALTVIFVVRLTGDSFHDYAMASIFKAAGGKGGAANVLAYPIHLPLNTIRYLHSWPVFYCVGAIATFVVLVRPFAQTRKRRDLPKAIAGLILILIPLHHFYPRLINTDIVWGTAAYGVYLLYGFGIFVFLRFLRWEFSPAHSYQWNRREILLLVPLGQLAAMSMSTGGFHYGVYGPPAMMILLLPVSSPLRIRADAAQSFLTIFALLVLCSGAAFKFLVPYAWHSYHAKHMFVGRQWYRHPVYGPMIIESNVLNFIEPICRKLDSGSTPNSLLSLPNPFANYFCAIPPWHGYVQTYYDTSTKQTIDILIDDLEKAPPEWILFQKEPRSLAVHEQIFNQGHALPQRFLDGMIEKNLAKGTWRVVSNSSFGSEYEEDTNWLLIRTQP